MIPKTCSKLENTVLKRFNFVILVMKYIFCENSKFSGRGGGIMLKYECAVMRYGKQVCTYVAAAGSTTAAAADTGWAEKGEINRAAHASENRVRWPRRVPVHVRYYRRNPSPSPHARARACHRHSGHHGHGQVGGQVATGQEVDHRRIRVRYLQRAGRRQTPARHGKGHRVSAGAVPDSRSRNRSKFQCGTLNTPLSVCIDNSRYHSNDYVH